MGWADCGTDSKGRSIGYGYGTICDQRGCAKEIDRGLSYACGGMHGDDEYSCEKYFCEDHQKILIETDQGNLIKVCSECEKPYIEDEDWAEDEDEGVYKRSNSLLK